MYQHPQALHLNADYLQHEMLRDADNRRLAREARAESHEGRGFDVSPFQRRMVALAVALLSVAGVVSLI
jgi:hypothetical protein